MRIGTKVTNPGELNKRITLKKRTMEKDVGSFQTPILTTLAIVWAKCINVHGAEVWAAQTVNALKPMTVLIRYRDDVDETCILVLDGKNYEIVSMDNIQHRGEYIELKTQLWKPG